jgi:hypothetical protein
MTAMDDYLILLQAVAVTVVACVLIVNAAGDLFSLEPTGGNEPGDGPPVLTAKYKGILAAGTRWLIIGKAGFLASFYTGLLGAIIAALTYLPRGWFLPGSLTKFFQFIIAITIFSVC